MSQEFLQPIVTVDTVLFTLFDQRLHILVMERDREPYQGQWALPGGYVHTNEDDEARDSACRVLSTKVGVDVSHLEQLATFSGARRDPRAWSVSVVYLALLPADQIAQNDKLKWVPADEVPPLAFDHNEIVKCGLARIRDKASYSSLPGLLMPKQFTLPQLQKVYEEVLGIELNAAAFRRKVLDQGIIEPVEDRTIYTGNAGRPAQVYQLSNECLQNLGRVVMTPDPRRGGPSM